MNFDFTSEKKKIYLVGVVTMVENFRIGAQRNNVCFVAVQAHIRPIY